MRVFLGLSVCVLIGATASAQQTTCTSYYVGTVLYSSCTGQPVQSSGINPMIPLMGVTHPPANAVDTLLKLEQARLAREQAALAKAQADALQAQRAQATATPAVIAASIEAPLFAPTPMMTGSWWNGMKQRAEKGDQTARWVRLLAVRGIIEGINTGLLASTKTEDDFKAASAAVLRKDLTYEQILAKVDDYFYADASRLDLPVSIGVMLALAPPKQ